MVQGLGFGVYSWIIRQLGERWSSAWKCFAHPKIQTLLAGHGARVRALLLLLQRVLLLAHGGVPTLDPEP